MSILQASPFEDYLLVRKSDCFILYDNEFELVMKEDAEEKSKEFKILKVDGKKFILKTENKASLWDIEEEDTSELKSVPVVSPKLTEFMSGQVIACDRWIEAYGVKQN
jgi:hypothetical protein